SSSRDGRRAASLAPSSGRMSGVVISRRRPAASLTSGRLCLPPDRRETGAHRVRLATVHALVLHFASARRHELAIGHAAATALPLGGHCWFGSIPDHHQVLVSSESARRMSVAVSRSPSSPTLRTACSAAGAGNPSPTSASTASDAG